MRPSKPPPPVLRAGPASAATAPNHPLPAGMRDLLPPEAAQRRRLSRRLLDHFSLYGYELVTPPAFELAEVLERGLGTLDPRDVLRFVEPESGEVAALRPDVTPQIARMAATRLADRPMPMRLCYEGTVLRRRQERARKHRQIPQAGVELLGVGGPEGDIELLELAAGSARAAGLSDFVLDVGHADIARALMSDISGSIASSILDALAHKDSAAVGDLVRDAKLAPALSAALIELPKLHGDAGVWKEADRLLAATPAKSALLALRDLWNRATADGLAGVLRVDLGEVRGFAYYTGAIFHILADGPGEPVGSGGRYDDLLARFGAPMPAAGFALDLDNLSWALRVRGIDERLEPRLLIELGLASPPVCAALRARGLGCAIAPESGAEAYARAWGFSHVLLVNHAKDVEVLEVSTGLRQKLAGGFAGGADGGRHDELASRLAQSLGSR
jgi:ATP phosphoribosyltransferase regulatory subunit